MALPLNGLRLLQVVSMRGSLSTAATELGYTQSAASRQLAALEREAGRRLVDRGPRGAQLTDSGRRLLPHAAAALDALARAEQAMRGEPAPMPLRVGVFPSAGPVLLPRLLTALTSPLSAPGEVTTREGSSPTLARAVEGGRLDAAVVVSRAPFRPFTDPAARIVEQPLGMMELLIAAAAQHPLALLPEVRIVDLEGVAWIGSTRAESGDPTLGAWPSLAHRPRIRYRTDDWLTRTRLVAAGLAVITVPPILADTLPGDVALLPVVDSPPEQRRLTLLASPNTLQRVPELLPALQQIIDELQIAGTESH